MAFSYPEIRSWQGLFLQQNSLSVPDGALETALNVVISKDGQITKRRGFYTFYTPVTGTLNRLFTYQNVLMAAFQSKLSYLTETGTIPNKTGVETPWVLTWMKHYAQQGGKSAACKAMMASVGKGFGVNATIRYTA